MIMRAEEKKNRIQANFHPNPKKIEKIVALFVRMERVSPLVHPSVYHFLKGEERRGTSSAYCLRAGRSG
jgi:hypothetical protein